MGWAPQHHGAYASYIISASTCRQHTAKYYGNLPPLKELLLAGGPQTEFIFGNEKFLNVNSMVLVNWCTE